jgi:hypothetical protein
LSGRALFAKNSELFVDDADGASADVMSQRVTLSDDDSDDDETNGETKSNFPSPPVSKNKANTIQVGGQNVTVGDASVFLDGDDDELDLDDLDD